MITANADVAGGYSNNIKASVNLLILNSSIKQGETNLTAVSNAVAAMSSARTAIERFKSCLTQDSENIVKVAERFIEKDIDIAAEIKEAFE